MKRKKHYVEYIFLVVPMLLALICMVTVFRSNYPAMPSIPMPQEDAFQPGWDLVVVARHRCLDAKFSALCDGYLNLARKAGILKEQSQ